MTVLNPQFVTDVESSMTAIIEREYDRLNQRLWWMNVATVRDSKSKKDLLHWLLSTATIKDEGKGGNIAFDDLLRVYTEIENTWSGNALKIRRDQFEDNDGTGESDANQWAADTAAQSAYYPQKRVAYFLKNAHLAPASGGFNAYDGQIFFSAAHPVNPYFTGAGTYKNIFTGGASGSYPGACPIDESVTLDVAKANLAKIYAYIASIPMPNGEDPRGLIPRGIIHPPRMKSRVKDLFEADFIAMAAASGGGSADVKGSVAEMGFVERYSAAELAGFESDTSFFVICEQMATSQLGAVVWNQREAYKIRMYGAMTQADLDRADDFEWHNKGRNAVAGGHPYLVFKAKGS